MRANAQPKNALPFQQGELVGIDTLKDHPRNYREHPDDQIAHIGRSLQQYGQYRNVVIAKDSTILAGHGVVRAALTIGWKEIFAVRLDLKPDEPQALKLLAADNELGHFAVIDDRELTEILREVKELDEFGLEGTGFDEMMLANLVMITRPESEIKDKDHASEWVGMPEFEKGEDKFPFRYNIGFKNQADRVAFAEKFEMPQGKAGAPMWITRWPDLHQDDLVSVKYRDTSEDEEAAQ